MGSFQALAHLPALASWASFPRGTEGRSEQEQIWTGSVGPEPLSVISGALVLNHRVQK